VRDKSGTLRRLTNSEIAKNPQYGDFSLDQGKLSIEDFYDRMDDVMSPAAARSAARHEGGDHLARGAGEGARDLGRERTQVSEHRQGRGQHAGRRRDFRNHRRLGGLRNAVTRPAPSDRDATWCRTFPERVERRPERYAMPRGKSRTEVKDELQRVLATELAERTFSYRAAVTRRGRSRSRTWSTASWISRWRTI
jgi:hypothetical protein